MLKISRAVSDRRLLALAKRVERLKPERFDFNYFVGMDWGGRADLSCGTTACMAGWATTMPMFRKLGLQLRQGAVFLAKTKTTAGVSDPWRALAVLFGLTRTEASVLFEPYTAMHATWSPFFRSSTAWGIDATQASPKEAAAHLRAFIKWRRSSEYKKGGGLQ